MEVSPVLLMQLIALAVFIGLSIFVVTRNDRGGKAKSETKQEQKQQPPQEEAVVTLSQIDEEEVTTL